MRGRIELILHWIIFISTFAAIFVYFVVNIDPSGDNGVACFKYFTTDSNVLACLASLFCILFHRKGGCRPQWVDVFQFISTISVTLTFITVIFFLSPVAAIQGKGISSSLSLFENNLFVLHVSTPVLSIAALMLANFKPSKWLILWSILPTAVYSVFYFIVIASLKIWEDWYGFTFGGHFEFSPLVMLVMYAVTALIAFIEWKIKNVIEKKSA